MQNPTEIAAPVVTVQLSGLVFAWMADQDLDQVTKGMRRGEVEWRTALRTATSRQIGRGVVYSIVVSHDAARELAGELGERAEAERRTPPADRVMSPWLLSKTADAIRKLLPVELQTA